MNNHLKGILVGAFILLICLLLMSKCHSCVRNEELAQSPEPQEEEVEDVEAIEDEDFDANDYGGNGVLKVTMAWEFPSDIDLHVIEPGGNEIYFANRRSSTSGWLDTDNLDGGRPGSPAVENVFWETAPAGRYVVKVKYFGTRAGGRNGGPVLVVIQVNGEETRHSVNLTHEGEEVVVDTIDYQP